LPPEILTAGYEHLLRPLLFRSHGGDPEAIHETMIALLARLGRTPAPGLIRLITGAPRSAVTVAGIRFPGRIGLAAGLDKDGLAAPLWGALGFGFAELGTVTPRPQPGNPAPRLFRLRRSRAILNRMGFNNDGAACLAERLNGFGARRGEGLAGIPLGVSIGKNKTTLEEEAVEDYLAALTMVAPYADYLAINVSSPNTPGLRRLQDAGRLRGLLSSVTRETRRLNPEAPIPVFVKVAPDLDEEGFDDVVAAVEQSGAAGLIATNTTVSRAGLRGNDGRLASEAGGLSGAPLTARARAVVAALRTRTRLPIIASGGVMTPSDAVALIDAGADLVEICTGFIYSGPGLVTGADRRLASHRSERI
jgi:dihydroorotate dehydrogenase